MALHGTPSSRNADAAPPLPRVHVTPRSTASASGLVPLLPRRNPAEVVSLAQPRPDGERVTNDYVEAPLRGEPCPPPRPGRIPSVPGFALRSSSNTTARLPLPTAAGKRGVVTKQPTSTYKKDARSIEPSVCPPADLSTSTICADCGLCRCDACRRPQPLPEKWLCNNKVYCSPEAVVDYVSCLCCVRALFYHCSKDYERDDGSAPCADEPCSCAAPRRCARWGCLAAISMALPCLLCYWPLRACLAGFVACHNRVTSERGCRCRDRPPPTVSAATAAATNKSLLDGSAADKRLLDSSPDA